jgi:hypothetical protein
MDIITPALHYLNEKGFAANRRILERIDRKLRILSAEQNDLIDQIVETYWQNLINLDDNTIILNSSNAKWICSTLKEKDIYCKINKDNELVIHRRRLRPIFPDIIVSEYLRLYSCQCVKKLRFNN